MLALTCLISAVGCKEATMQSLETRQKKTKDYKHRKILKPSKPITPPTPNPNLKRRPAPPSGAMSGSNFSTPTSSSFNSDLERSFQASRATALTTGKPEEVAIRRVNAAVQAALEVSPTLIVWVIDRTPSASKIVTDSLAAARAMYDQPEVRTATINDSKLLTAVVSFDAEVDFLLDPPVGDWQQAKAAFDKIQPVAGGKEMPFTALQQVLDKYLPLRTQDRREIVIVLITDEAGDDRDKVDGIVDIVKKYAIPVYTIGVPAPWGQTNPYLAAGAKASGPDDDTYPTHGPESLQSERVDVSMWSNQVISREDLSMIDSGFGPYALERLCRASGGEFFAVRPSPSAVYQYRGMNVNHKFWPTGSELRFDPKVVEKYAPQYVSQSDYERLLSANKAWNALVEAAKLPKINIEAYPEQTFEKRNEAQFTRQLNTAQQFAARHSPPVDALYNVLSAGESDREKLTSPRLHAEFDLALGRTLAAKVRLDGYNAMLAQLKRGKNFTNESSRRWHIEQSSTIETGSQLQKMSDKAIMYLKRVQNDHPGTPWAKIAEQELKIPLGWEWRES
jgi:hypothetical protein